MILTCFDCVLVYTGYSADGIYNKTQEWIENNDEIDWESNPKMYMARGNAFMNESQNERALTEFGHALRISLHLKMDKCVTSQTQLFAREYSDEIQTRLLMVVLLNKMNNVKAAANHCEAILAYDETHESARKLYAAILFRQKKYRVEYILGFCECLAVTESPFCYVLMFCV